MLRYGLVVAAVACGLDRASKWWLMDLMADAGGRLEVLPFFNLVMVWNPGVSFGMFQTGSAWAPWLLSGVALIIIAILLRWLIKTENKWEAGALGLVIGGAFGNVIDRLVWGRVADFFDAHVAGWHWPAFNIADAAIVVGAAILVFDGLFAGRGRDTK